MAAVMTHEVWKPGMPGRRHAVVGLGATGRSVVDFLARRGVETLAMDTRDAPPALGEVRARHPALDVVTGGLDADALACCPVVVVSPGVALDQPALVAARAAGCRVIGDIELFALYATAPVVAITGTNGKSTVTTLVAEILAASGLAVRRGANLGTPALDLLTDGEPDCYVLELSSFQLELCESLAPQVAAVLNIAPDHIDRHGSLERYTAAKARILAHAEVAVLNADDPVVAALPCSARRVLFTFGAPGPGRYGMRDTPAGAVLASGAFDFVARADLALAGTHNVANVLAAIAICDTRGTERSAIIRTVRDFRGLPHRCETVATVRGVRYVNDSKATNPGAACASLLGILAESGGVVIAGGEPKGVAFDDLADAIVATAHSAVLIGQAADAIERALAGRVECVRAADMAGAVRAASRAAEDGETVLLAPACASFDMFDNYAARGEAFRAAVSALGGD